ncbi:receptor-like serine/threonine-protein kinase ALE2 [Neltuma alba]|uniref:receptor-like serine/threonine-protein kinase ALE2 n=1 Tax=Neltuma alba TaxID=207710 RepID=UPI0010A45A51|nr:receptor-like serine/threonine-protein kinase ALE2 [Prosopis alba]XP_028789780.1 receptor-like serine/threonine-protein kinase ALE2 [Prosopis alba]
MGLQLTILLFMLHLVFSAPQLHEYRATNLHHSRSHSSIALPPSQSSPRVPASIAIPPSKSLSPGSVRSPISHHKHHHSRRKSRNPTPTYNHGGHSVFPAHPPFPSPKTRKLPAPAPAPLRAFLSVPLNAPSPSPRVLPLHSKHTKDPSPSPVLGLPPPPPNNDCMSLTCSEPLTYAPSGSPCACVWPLQVKLDLGIAIYKFFPLVSKLAEEIAAGVSLNRSQVRIVGADAANHQLEKTNVLINLVPEGVNFDDATAFSIYKKFWHKEILTDASLFGSYEVLYVHYPGLPPSPPLASSSISSMDDVPYPGYDYNGTIMKPLGVNVPVNGKHGSSERGSMIIIIVLSCITVSVLFIGAAWLYLLKCGSCVQQPEHIPDDSILSSSKPSGAIKSLTYGSIPGSRSMSFSSGTIIYTGSVRTFTLNEIEKATNNFDALRIIGEGGFGLVYKGFLHDGRDVAVKILKRYDQHGGREFLAEVEMLSRLHHRNLVKLIGICMENQTRCLIYELIPNGSVESHLHGSDKKTSPLDWNARMKIALGAARGLAYLHEDSNPCVIHRDFKSSNILLEHDFTPKVADFGLARTALDGGNKHISTHVMGTFGYLAPEYAMTGHLLVKSDVYSYGVVLLELLTGRKPVDFSQPPGQENLVAWVRPLLTSKDGLQTIIDPVLESNVSFEAVVKVAAIASTCVQPEVSQRPFMGEVVQALKLVCCEFDDTSIMRSRSFHEESVLIDGDGKFSRISGEMMGFQTLTESKLLSPLSDQGFESFRRHSDSEPLTTEKKRKVWQKLRSSSGGSVSEHGFSNFPTS